MTYTLNVLIDADYLGPINKAKEKVVLIKLVTTGGKGTAWVTFDPFQQNVVSWNNSYYIYASLIDPVEGAQIIINLSTPAQVRYEYTFTDTFFNGQFNSQLEVGQYGVSNQVPYNQRQWVTFGMAQPYTVNGEAIGITPINAQVVPALHSAKFTPTETVQIFLASDIENGTVHNIDDPAFSSTGSTKIPSLGYTKEAESVTTELSFGSNKQTITVAYDANLAKFIPQ